MNQEEHLLIVAMEECNEVSHRISKALRFGLNEIQPNQLLSNRDRIVYELLDLFAVVELLENSGVFLIPEDGVGISIKRDKLKKYMDYAKSIGTLQ